jgi:hypothetical protein
MTKPIYTKGQTVTFISDWDGKGTVSVTQGLQVYSCGQKRMILVDENGARFQGAEFRPDDKRVYRAMEDDAALALAREIGAKIIIEQTAHFNERIARWGDQVGFRAAMEKSLRELHEPRAFIMKGVRKAEDALEDARSAN